MSRDALMDAPVPMAVKRSRRIDPVLRDSMAKATMEGTIAKTGDQTSSIMQRARRWKIRRVGSCVANRSIIERMLRYH